MGNRWKPVRLRWDDSLTRVGWDDFERRVAEYYRGQGYRVEHTGTGATFGMSDGGIDLKLFRGGEYTVVQCKHWNAGQVPHNAVHELIGVMHTQGAQRAILISSGEFTDHAMRSAEKYMPIQLIGGAEIRAMLGPIPEMDMPSSSARGEVPSWVVERRHRRRKQPASAKSIAAGFVAFAAIVMIVCFYIPRVFSNMSAGIIRSTSQSVANARANARDAQARPTVNYPDHYASHAMTPARYSDRQTSDTADAQPPITTADGKPRATGSTPTTKAEIAAWQAENAKSMKILERTTPELGSN
jgi:hypothetical protein